MGKFIKNIVYGLLSRFNFSGAVVLMYHSVAANNEFSTVRPEDFEKQMEYLRDRGFNVIKLSELAAKLEAGDIISSKTVVLTFDDGYEDNYSTAFPILKKYGFPATIFVMTSCLDNLFETKRGNKIKILSAGQVKEMQENRLVEFGTHSHQHLKLVNHQRGVVENELKDSKTILEKKLGKEVAMLSYPSGKFNDEVEKIARQNYRIICTVTPGRMNIGDPIWRVKRNSVDSMVSFGQFKGIVKFGRIL